MDEDYKAFCGYAGDCSDGKYIEEELEMGCASSFSDVKIVEIKEI